MAVKVEEGPPAKECQRLLGAEQGKETDSRLEPPEGALPCQLLLSQPNDPDVGLPTSRTVR